MAECEICGREAQLYTVEIDRARLRVCFDCSKSGKLLESPRPPAVPKGPMASQRQASHKVEFDVVADYGPKIKSAREKMHITRDVLAEMINEKESFLDRVEAEKVLPTEALVKKLERALGIRLYEEVGVGQGPVSGGQKKGLTLGDVITIKKKGEKRHEEE